MQTSKSSNEKVPYNRELGRKIIQESVSSISPEAVIYADKGFRIALKIRAIMAKKGLKQSDIVRITGRGKAEISRWLSGTHNFTLRTLAILEATLGEDLMDVNDGKANELNDKLKERSGVTTYNQVTIQTNITTFGTGTDFISFVVKPSTNILQEPEVAYGKSTGSKMRILAA
jgi:transcriptional regulator with XRE-family HTH domain